MNITVILPTYRNPEYLDLCLKSITENKIQSDTQVITIVDGFPEESQAVLNKYSDVHSLVLPHNTGMANAINFGVYNADTELILVINDDNVFCTEWDARLEKAIEGVKFPYSSVYTNGVMTINQIEPSPSIFNFPVSHLGTDVKSFQYDEFLNLEKQSCLNDITPDGRIFPFVMSKKNFMMVGGFDIYYNSPFWVDCDFWLKLEIARLEFYRTHNLHFYHFGSKATKFGKEGDKFRASENVAANQFKYKWQYIPDIVKNVSKNNTKLPDEKIIGGIDFYGWM